MKDWINNRFRINLTDEDLASIRDFSLVWNVFERTICDNNCSSNQLVEKLSNIDFEIDDFAEHLDYFKKRYVLNGEINDRFKYLRLRHNDNREIVEDVLLGRTDKPCNVVIALAIIVFRFRNNLFHGLKQMEEIDQQKENFERANNILKSILDYFNEI